MEKICFSNNILVVDDKLENLQLLVEMLKKEGYDPRVATNGKLAIKAIHHKKPDLILLDINMPEMNGYEVCQVLKEDQNFKDIPIIFLSALNETFDKVKAFELGGIDYITKPFQTKEVSARIKTQLNLRHYQIEIEQKNKELEFTLNKLRETQTQLILAEKMSSLGVLSAGLAHEIKKPIESIKHCSNMLVYSFDDLRHIIADLDNLGKLDESLQKKLDEFKKKNEFENLAKIFDEMTSTISKASSKTEEIITGVGDFVRSENNGTQKIDVHDIIEMALVLTNNLYKNKIQIKKEFSDLPKVFCNGGKLSQVIINVISNACDSILEKKNSSKDSIFIKTSLRNNNLIVIDIIDTGIGIKEDIKNNLFDPFFTTKKSDKRPGLGLSISYGIIESMRGSISFDSEINKGAKFTITLPVE